ncbi:unnamed protein product, partial [Larinioides sclopetarius]
IHPNKIPLSSTQTQCSFKSTTHSGGSPFSSNFTVSFSQTKLTLSKYWRNSEPLSGNISGQRPELLHLAFCMSCNPYAIV